MALLVVSGRRDPWSCEGSLPQCREMPVSPTPTANTGEWVGWSQHGRGEGIGDFSEGKPGKGLTKYLKTNKQNSKNHYYNKNNSIRKGQRIFWMSLTYFHSHELFVPCWLLCPYHTGSTLVLVSQEQGRGSSKDVPVSCLVSLNIHCLSVLLPWTYLLLAFSLV